jgi:methylenetetrahydrofolate reductase (NADPH)
MARRLSVDVPQLAVPESIIDLLDRDRGSGVDIACDHVRQIYESKAFDGVHLIPVNRYREMATRLETLLR